LNRGIPASETSAQSSFLGSGAASGLDLSSLSEIPSFLALRRQEYQGGFGYEQEYSRPQREEGNSSSINIANDNFSSNMFARWQLPSSISLQDAT
jgi:hypothetical protein